jgi:hypothetical protein
MSRVRVLVGTRKGAFILESDGKRERWEVSGPHFGGWEIYHVKGSLADPNRLYASQTSGWFGQIIQRSDDGGKNWHQPGTPPGEPTTDAAGFPRGESNKFVYDTSAETGKPLTTHQWYDGTPHPWEFKRVWHLEPSVTDPDSRRYRRRPCFLADGIFVQRSFRRAGTDGFPVAAARDAHTIITTRAIRRTTSRYLPRARSGSDADAGKTWRLIGGPGRNDPSDPRSPPSIVHRDASFPPAGPPLSTDVMRSDDGGDRGGGERTTPPPTAASTFTPTSQRRSSFRSRATLSNVRPTEAEVPRSAPGGNEWRR